MFPHNPFEKASEIVRRAKSQAELDATLIAAQLDRNLAHGRGAQEPCPLGVPQSPGSSHSDALPAKMLTRIGYVHR